MDVNMIAQELMTAGSVVEEVQLQETYALNDRTDTTKMIPQILKNELQSEEMDLKLEMKNEMMLIHLLWLTDANQTDQEWMMDGYVKVEVQPQEIIVQNDHQDTTKMIQTTLKFE